MRKYFGTDGVRGKANIELTPELAFQLGKAAAYILQKKQKKAVMIIGKDTRLSGDVLEAALTAGICSVGVDVIKAGIIPTPGVAFLTRELGACGGAVISASHNPFADNGIKFFNDQGYKLSDNQENEIEKLLFGEEITYATDHMIGRVLDQVNSSDKYETFLKQVFKVDLTGIKLVVDCANGAAYQIAPEVYRALGAEVVVLADQPDGCNINVECGSTDLKALKAAVLAEKADLGIAHDGDADRMLAVDEQGQEVSGDQILVACSLYLKEKKALDQNTLVVTVMSNLGLHDALTKAGIKVKQTKVGDRYVLEEMLKTGAVIGGEQSGHIIYNKHATTGDGILSALLLLNVLQAKQMKMSEVAGQMDILPQVLKNVKVSKQQAWENNVFLKEKIQKAEAFLENKGRLLIRPSGTEPIIRVMAEGHDEEEIMALVDDLAAAFAAELQ